MLFFRMDDFLDRFAQMKLVYGAGAVGSDKTSLGVALSYWLHREGLVDATVGNVPVAWATPVSEAPLYRVCLLVDELGSFYDARNFSDKKANAFRHALLQFPRKVQSYVIVCSRLVVDKSFRSLTVQRTFHLGGLWQFSYAMDEGALDQADAFYIWGLSDLYKSPLLANGFAKNRFFSSYYATGYIPSGVEFLADWARRAVEAALDVAEYDPNSDWSIDDNGMAKTIIDYAEAQDRKKEETKAELSARGGGSLSPSTAEISITEDGVRGDVPSEGFTENYGRRKNFRELLKSNDSKGRSVSRSILD